MSNDKIMAALDTIEADIKKSRSLSETEIKNLGDQQRDLANRLLKLEGRSAANSADWGGQVVESKSYEEFVANRSASRSASIEVKNSITNTVGGTLADRRIGVVPGAFTPMSLESLFPSLPAESNAIDYVRENVFTNSAAETAEGSAAPESSITFTPAQASIRDVSHWLKISRQLAEDGPALAAYINNRMTYGVNRRVETQLALGNGAAPNLSGVFNTGNFTAHGYTDAQLTSSLKKFELIRRCIGDLQVSGYVPDAILLNPQDWTTLELDMLTNNPTIASVADLNNGVPPRLFGVNVVVSTGVAADTFAVGEFARAGTIYNRAEVNVDLSYSDSDNFTKQLVTVFSSRRLALAVESPAAVRAGDLTPA